MSEKPVLGFKLQKYCMNVLVYTNTSGKHWFHLVVIG